MLQFIIYIFFISESDKSNIHFPSIPDKLHRYILSNFLQLDSIHFMDLFVIFILSNIIDLV